MSGKSRAGATPDRGWFRKGRSGNPEGRPAASPPPRASRSGGANTPDPIWRIFSNGGAAEPLPAPISTNGCGVNVRMLLQAKFVRPESFATA